jgi:hypothetical protein
MFSKALKGTAKKKTTLNWWEYWIGHCWMTGWQSMRLTFRIWADLMTSNYENYALPRTVEDPEAECIDWFWTSLNEDDVYDKEFLEYLLQMVEDIDTGKVKTYPMEDVMKKLEDTLETGTPEDTEES